MRRMTSDLARGRDSLLRAFGGSARQICYRTRDAGEFNSATTRLLVAARAGSEY